MNGRIVFLLEEPSMKTLLDGLLPRLFRGWLAEQHFLCVPHEGKSDLDRSIAVKLKGWRIPGDRFVIVRDIDNAKCVDVKARIQQLCGMSGRPDTLVRLVCQELESWYIGDLRAVARAFDVPSADTPALRKRFYEPDQWQKPSIEVKRLIPEFQKINGARTMALYLDPADNRSRSFQVFVEGVRRMAAELGHKEGVGQ